MRSFIQMKMGIATTNCLQSKRTYKPMSSLNMPLSSGRQSQCALSKTCVKHS